MITFMFWIIMAAIAATVGAFYLDALDKLEE
jgi:hypothetical protein